LLYYFKFVIILWRLYEDTNIGSPSFDLSRIFLTMIGVTKGEVD